MVGLSLYILQELAHRQADNGGGAGVAMSTYRKELGIPNSTFHRAMKQLIDIGFVKRMKRDSYAINPYYGRLFNLAAFRGHRNDIPF